MVETAIVIPFLALLFLALTDFYFLSNAYFSLTHIVREAAVTITACKWNYDVDCVNEVPAGSGTPERVSTRVAQLMATHELLGTGAGTLNYHSSDITIIRDPGTMTLTVKLTPRYQSYTPFFSNLTVLASTSGIYYALPPS